MDCAAVQRWFSPYLDGLLATSERATLEEHLTGCARCRSDLESLKQMLASLRAMERPKTPELLPGIHAQLHPHPWWQPIASRFLAPWPESLPWHGLALAGSAALIAILVVIPEYRLKVKAPAPDHLQFQLSQVPSQARQFHGEDRNADRASVLERTKKSEVAQTASLDHRQLIARGEQEGYGWGADREDGSSRSVAGAPGLALSAGATAASEPKADDELASEAPAHPLEVRWRVSDLTIAASQVCEWVLGQQGGCVAMDERHLAISLLSSEVPQFLQQFSTPLVGTEIIGPTSAAGIPLPTVVPISLELIPSE